MAQGNHITSHVLTITQAHDKPGMSELCHPLRSNQYRSDRTLV